MAVKVDWRVMVLAVVAGVCIGLLTGFVENKSGGYTIPENSYYGYPLIWRISSMNTGETFLYLELFVDCLPWIAVFLIIALLAKKLIKQSG